MGKSLVAIGVALVVGVAVLVLDPMGLFRGPDWQYGDVEMRIAVEGTWALTVQDEQTRETTTWRFVVRQGSGVDRTGSRGLLRSAQACSNRSLVRNAAACADSTSMPLEITVLDVAKPPAATGHFMSGSFTFDGGELDIVVGDLHATHGRLVAASAYVLPNGTADHVHASVEDRTPVESVYKKIGKSTLVRTSATTTAPR